MGNNLKFNSSVCTTREQSQRLLNLGLKPETADMVLIKELAYDEVAHCTYDADTYMIRPIDYLEGERHRGHIPSWSLHRLIELLPQDIHLDDYEYTHYWLVIDPLKVIYKNSHSSWIYSCDEGGLYDKLINTIEWTIKNNHFNKVYLKQ